MKFPLGIDDILIFAYKIFYNKRTIIRSWEFALLENCLSKYAFIFSRLAFYATVIF